MTLILSRVSPFRIIPEFFIIKTAALMRGGCEIESDNIAT